MHRPGLIAVILAVGALALPASAQQTRSDAAGAEAVQLSVVVTDRTGAAVPGLARDDFEIRVDGKPQKIAALSEAADTPANVLLLIDTWSTGDDARKATAASIAAFVRDSLRAGDTASIASWNGTFRVEQPFTRDRAALLSALDRIAQQPQPRRMHANFQDLQRACNASLEIARTTDVPMTQAYDDCIATAKADLERTLLFTRGLLTAMDAALATMPSGGGRNALVVTGALLPRSPGVETYAWANQLFRTRLSGFNAPTEKPDPEALRTHHGQLDETVRNANAKGVTLYTITIDAPEESLNVASRYVNADDGFRSLADGTGGLATSSGAHAADAFAAIANDLRAGYLLSFTPALAESAIAVSTKRQGFTSRARRSVSRPSQEEKLADRVIGNIFAPEPAGTWRVALQSGAASPKGDGFEVPVDVVIPSLTLAPRGGKLQGGFSVFIAVGNDQAAVTPVSRQNIPVTIPPEEEASFRAEPVLFSMPLKLRAGRNHVSVAVVDAVSKEVAFARATIAVP